MWCVTLRATLIPTAGREFVPPTCALLLIMRTLSYALVAAALLPLSVAAAQPATMVYKLGTDTLAIEQFIHTATKLTGEMVQRSGVAVVRVQYDMTLGADGRPTAATMKRLQADGTPAPGAPSEARFRITADSIVRDLVFADSTQHRAFAASHAMVNFPVFVYGPTEVLAVMRKKGTPVDSIVALGFTGNLGFTGLAPDGADAARIKGGSYAMLLKYDANAKLQSLDGSGTTNKAMATRGARAFDLATVARGMKATGVLSSRDVARGAFGPGGMVLVDYGRPMVRERSVWGGTLVPFDSVWRAGANDATHLFTTRVLTLGDMTLAPGMYSLWIQHTHSGTFLIVNKGTGQWGTQYDATKDLGRVAMTLAPTPSHVEELTMTVRAISTSKGALELAWGPSVASVPFGVSNR